MSTFATDFPRKLTLPTILLLALASSPAHSDSVSNDPVEVLRCWTTPATGHPCQHAHPRLATSIIDLPLFAGARPAQAGSPADKAPAPVTSTGAAGKTSVEATVGKPVTTTLASGCTTSPTTATRRRASSSRRSQSPSPPSSHRAARPPPPPATRRRASSERRLESPSSTPSLRLGGPRLAAVRGRRPSS